MFQYMRRMREGKSMSYLLAYVCYTCAICAVPICAFQRKCVSVRVGVVTFTIDSCLTIQDKFFFKKCYCYKTSAGIFASSIREEEEEEHVT